MENKDESNLERKVNTFEIVKYLGLHMGKCFIPVIGDKMVHRQANEGRKQKDIFTPKIFMTFAEIGFYGAKYYILYSLGSKLYNLTKDFF